MLIDTHCHLNFKTFADRVDQTIKEAKEADINAFVVPGANLNSSQKALELAEKYPNVYASVGIHPVHAGQEFSIFKSQLSNRLEKLAGGKKVVAIGECGLDYHQYKKLKIKDKKYILKNKNIQKKIFIIQVRLAHKFKLTLIVHNREADLDILKLLNSNNLKISIPLLFHSFEGQKKIWQFAKNKENAYLGINGLLTYNDNLKNIIKSIPLAKIVLETDSPYLRPRIKEKVFSFPNTPKNVKIVARYLAKLKNTSLADVEKNSTKNAKKIFGIK